MTVDYDTWHTADAIVPGLCSNVCFAYVKNLNIMIHSSNVPHRGYGLLAQATTSAEDLDLFPPYHEHFSLGKRCRSKTRKGSA
jgi:hypothetical protein